MLFHAVCNLDLSAATHLPMFHSFEPKILTLPGFEHFSGKLEFVKQPSWGKFENEEWEYNCVSYRVEADGLPEEIKNNIRKMGESSEDFYDAVRYFFDSAVALGIYYFYAIQMMETVAVPDGMKMEEVTPEIVETLKKNKIIVLRGCPKKQTTNSSK